MYIREENPQLEEYYLLEPKQIHNPKAHIALVGNEKRSFIALTVTEIQKRSSIDLLIRKVVLVMIAVTTTFIFFASLLFKDVRNYIDEFLKDHKRMQKYVEPNTMTIKTSAGRIDLRDKKLKEFREKIIDVSVRTVENLQKTIREEHPEEELTQKQLDEQINRKALELFAPANQKLAELRQACPLVYN